MLFLNSRVRNATISGMSLHDRSCPHKIGHSLIIGGCLAVMTGLILIVVGAVSDVKNTTFIGVGIISLGVGFFLMTLVCFYAKLDTCYNNWAYRSRVIPGKTETPQTTPLGVATTSALVPSSATTQKRQSTVPVITKSPIIVATDVQIHNFVIAPSVNVGPTIHNSDNVP